MFEGLFRPMHLLILLAIVVIMFPKKLGELGKGLGEGIFGFRDALRDHSAPPATKEDVAKDKEP